MKKKFSKFLGVGLALVLVLSFSLIPAVPAAAAVAGSTFTVTGGTYSTVPTDPDPEPQTGDIGATLTGSWVDSAVIGEFTATGEGGLYLVDPPAGGPPPWYGSTADISVRGTLSEFEITFSGTAVRTEGDPITLDSVTGIVGTLIIQPDGSFVADLSGNQALGYPVNIDMTGSMVRPITNVRTTENFFTIQAAIDDADTGPGDTITVGAGTYAEQVVINKGLMLQGTGDDTVIQPSGPGLTATTSIPWIDGGTGLMAAIVSVETTGDEVIIRDLKIDASLITSKPTTWMAGLVYLETSGTIENLTVTINSALPDRTAGIFAAAVTYPSLVEVTECNVIGYNRAGIYALGAQFTANYHHNEINGPGSISTGVPNGMFFLEGANGSATYNVVTDLAYNPEVPDIYQSTGIGTYQAGSAITFAYNTVYQVQNAFALAKGTIGTIVEYNTVYSCHTGVKFESGASSSIIRYNDIHDNDFAIRGGVEMGLGNVVNFNNFVDNPGPEWFGDGVTYEGAVCNLSTTNSLDAENNWWGSASGPTHASNTYTNPAGDPQGGAVIGLVDFVPWYDTDMTGTSFAPVALDGDADYSSIQAAIDAATSSTITCAAGTYLENITIDRTLTLEGAQAGVNARGRTGPESIIDADLVPFAVLVIGEGTIATFDGFTVENYERGGILAGSFSLLEDDPFEAHILNNIVTAPGSLVDQNNNCIQVGDGTTGTIIGNEVNGANLVHPDWSGSGILVAGSSDVLVSNNHAYDCDLGIAVSGYAVNRDAPAEDNLIENNLVENNVCGITVQMNSINTIITYNDVLNNTESGIESVGGISWEPTVPSGTEIHYNNIVGNAVGVQSSVWEIGEPEELDATNNWWGNASGPSHSPGEGDPVGEGVLYNPWLLEPLLPGEPLPTTFEKTLPLKIGWTLVSVDNWIDPASAVGGGVILAVNYIPGVGWVQVTPAALVPVDALYLKTEIGGGVGFDYSEGAPGASSKDLEAGWNLISSATIENARAILSPLRFIDVGEEQGVGMATLVSQGYYNQYSLDFYLSTISPTDWGDGDGIPNGDRGLAGITLYPFDGYWVYMNGPKNFGVIPGVQRS